MRLNYRKLGEYIELVSCLNADLRYGEDDVRGVSNNKEIIQTRANNEGRDFNKFYVVETNDFIYNSRTSRMGEKVGLGYNDNEKTFITSFNNTVFRVKNKALLPTYLFMWFNRPEFDRYVRFHSWGSSTEIFSWEEMCNTLLPIPHIDKQREIVEEYKVIQNRIALYQQLIQKLEETAQAIYKQWFVDFEFPDENGKPYKSSGGEMVWNEELEKEIPLGWGNITVKDFCIEMKSGGTPSRINPEYWNSNDVPWLKTGEIKNNIILSTEEYTSYEGLKNSSAKLLPKDTVLMSMYGVNAGEIGILKFEASTNQACCGMICEDANHSAFLYYHLLHNQEFIASQSIGGAQENLSKDYVEKIPILKPLQELLQKADLKIIIDNKENCTKQNQKLSELKDLLLSKLATIEN